MADGAHGIEDDDEAGDRRKCDERDECGGTAAGVSRETLAHCSHLGGLQASEPLDVAQQLAHRVARLHRLLVRLHGTSEIAEAMRQRVLHLDLREAGIDRGDDTSLLFLPDRGVLRRLTEAGVHLALYEVRLRAVATKGVERARVTRLHVAAASLQGL